MKQIAVNLIWLSILATLGILHPILLDFTFGLSRLREVTAAAQWPVESRP